MLNRRFFVAGAAGMALSGIAAAGRGDDGMPISQPVDVLGRPPSSALDQIRDPITPDRVVVIDRGRDGQTSDRHKSLKAMLSRPYQVDGVGGQSLGPFQAPGGKLDTIFRMMGHMTHYYRTPRLFAKWSIGLARREGLGSTGVGRGFALIHQFQDDAPVQPKNGAVDWWLILFPSGVDWESFDGEPVFGMIAHVFRPRPFDSLGLKMRAWMLATIVGQQIGASPAGDGWSYIARLDRSHAARLVNAAIYSALPSTR